jgi:uncharacterized membrane protein YbhN (UPF0104 family)
MKKVKILGYIITAISFYYLIRVVLNLNINLLRLENPFLSIAYIGFWGIIYAILILLVSFSWRLIIEYLSGERVLGKEAFRVYAQANIAKYLPGNVMHFVGRNYLGSRLGWKHEDIAISSFLEIVFVVITIAILFLILSLKGFIYIPKELSSHIHAKRFITYAIILITVVSIFLFLHKTGKLHYDFKKFYSRKILFLFIKIFLVYSFIFFSTGIILVFIIHSILNFPLKPENIMTIISVFILSWFVGFIIPGAPGGIGIRESVIVLLLSPVYGEGNSLIASLILRVVTILGEVLAFCYAYFLVKPGNKG